MNDDASSNGAPPSGTPDPIPSVTASDDLETPLADAELGQAPVPPVIPAAAPAIRTQNRLALAGTVGLVLVLVVGGAFLLSRGPAGSPSPSVGIGATPSAAGTSNASMPVQTPPASDDPLALLPSEGSRLGRADAKVTVVYWADYQCPFCATFAQEGIPPLVPQIADGTIALVHRDFAFIGPESFDAAVAVRCAGRDGRYWPMHDAVYAAQDGENQGAFSRDRLAAIGETVGLEGSALEACFEDRALLVDVLADTSEAVRTAVASTPTVEVNGTRFLGVPKPAELQAAIDSALAGASPAPMPTQAPLRNPWAGVATSGRVAGEATAPVTVDLWMDYQSADGGDVARTLDPELIKRVGDGRIRVALHDLAILGDESVVAGTAIRCVDAQGGPTFLVHDILAISGQGPDAGIYVPENLLRLGAQLGLDVRALDACLADDAVAGGVRDDTDAGKAMGLDKAPGVVISVGAKEVARFSGTLDVAAILIEVDKAIPAQ